MRPVSPLVAVVVVLAAAFAFVASLVAGDTAVAADLDRPIVAAPPLVVEEIGNLCVIRGPGGSVEVYQEPRGEVWGNLPNGMIVEVMDAPYTDRTDLWVRIKPPRINNYYGWVETSRFSCA